MKIAQSTVSLQSQHASVASHSQQESVRAWVGARRPERPDTGGNVNDRAQAVGVQLSLSVQARAALAQATLSEHTAQVRSLADTGAAADANAIANSEDSIANDPKIQLVMRMVEAITGRAVRVFDARELQVRAAPAAAVNGSQATQTSQAQNGATAPRAGWGVEVTRTESVYEFEQTQVAARGVVRTADGQEIRFAMQLAMRREFSQETQASVRMGDAAAPKTDPLVINFNGTAAQLSDTRFSFDINADGQQESIATLAAGSGFLALDKNQDGRINDGSELFGPASGNGFDDLARYDSDGNNWIDANDAIFAQLRVWQRSADGQDKLGTLAESGVGALHLGQVASPFSVRDANNQSLGQVRSSGVFLYESGQVGSLQQVDL
ncbi:MAG: hypothetical protein IPH35_07055 [Rhodoferax sp.]|nr:hypothetical protein [Rhodoferax sp.]